MDDSTQGGPTIDTVKLGYPCASYLINIDTGKVRNPKDGFEQRGGSLMAYPDTHLVSILYRLDGIVAVEKKYRGDISRDFRCNHLTVAVLEAGIGLHRRPPDYARRIDEDTEHEAACPMRCLSAETWKQSLNPGNRHLRTSANSNHESRTGHKSRRL